MTPLATSAVPGRYDLVVVANRLPVDQVESPNGDLEWRISPGGLVTALEPVMRAAEGAWIGWSGSPGQAPEPFEHDHIQLVGVGLSAQEVEDYYEGFSNATLWPLYHDVIAPPEFHREWWEAYTVVNRRFAEAAAGQASPRSHRLGARLPAAAGARACCASCAPTCGSGSSTTSPSRATRSSPSCRGAGRSSTACSART